MEERVERAVIRLKRNGKEGITLVRLKGNDKKR